VTYPISGSITLDGAPFDATMCNDPSWGATIRFSDHTRGYTFDLVVSCTDLEPGVFSGNVYAGTYDVTINGHGSYIPNIAYAAEHDLIVQAPATGLAFDVETVSLSGSLTLNGAPPDPALCADPARGAAVMLHDAGSGDTFLVTVPCAASGPWVFSGTVYPGTYDVVVRGQNSGVPGGGYLTRSGLPIQSGTVNIALDLPAPLNVSGTITVNGVSPSAADCPPDGMAGIHFRDPDRNYSLYGQTPCDANGTSFQVSPYPGDYEVTVWTQLSSGSDLFIAEPSLSIRAPVSDLSLDIKRLTISGQITLGGDALPATSCADPTKGAYLRFDDTTVAGYIFELPVQCDPTGPWTFTGSIYPGTYDVTIAGARSALPDGVLTIDSALAVAASVYNLAWDLPALELVTGSATLNGAPSPSSSCSTATDGGAVAFSNSRIRESLPLYCLPNGAWGFSGEIYSGTYDVGVLGLMPAMPVYPTQTGLAVTSSVSGLVYDVRTYPVAGVVTLNANDPPAAGCSAASNATVYFEERSLGYGFAFVAACPPDGPWSFSGAVYPGTYDISVLGYLSGLPPVRYLVYSGVKVP
jgi:hypothetical protein